MYAKLLAAFALLGLITLATGSPAAPATIFPIDVPSKEWQQFKAEGFDQPVCGVVYRRDDKVTNGMPLGGIDTGCLDIETSGLLGYCTIFNSHIPRRGPINLPFLGLCVAGKTWVLCDPRDTKQGWGGYQGGIEGKTVPPVPENLNLTGVGIPRKIHYWGHYPVADLEFEADAPVSVGVRAWSPFLPGDVVASMLPGFVLEVHLRNSSSQPQKGTIAFSFPGPTADEAGSKTYERDSIAGDFSGTNVKGRLASYALGVIGNERARFGGELGADARAWAAITGNLPTANADSPGSSAAVDFDLAPGASRVVRFALTWCSPQWNGIGTPQAKKLYPGYSGEARSFRHMYAKHYPNSEQAALKLAREHEALLARVLAWQQVIYSEERLPPWLRDSLINVLYMITEDGYWAQKADPLPNWVREEDGLFGLNECPRGCPQIECIPCSFYGSLPLVYFFPELQLSTIRGYKGYQYPDGGVCWIFGGCTGHTPYIDFAYPTRGYQFASNGISLAAIVDRFLMCRDTPDKKLTAEFYPMIKSAMKWTVGLRTTPSYTPGEKIISMPDRNEGTEWFEAPEPGWAGMTAHIGGLHLAQLRITERLAQQVGDREFEQQCAKWIDEAQHAMERRLWDSRGYYLNYFEPETKRKSDLVFGYQLDGEWITDHHGLPQTLPTERVRTTLATIQRCNVAATKFGAVNYTNPDGTPAQVKGYGTYSYFPPEALMLAMNYMYEGQRQFGLDLAHKVWRNLVCTQGYTWDMPNIMRGDVETGERTFGNDYYQDMILWSLPAALAGQDVSGPVHPGGLVDRVLKAASASNK